MRLGRRAWLVLVVSALAALIGLAGCAAIQATRNTELALQRAGFHQVVVDVNTDVVSVEANVNGPAADLAAERRAAAIVWSSFHYRIAEVDVTLHGSDGNDDNNNFTRDDLEAAFGARNPKYDRRSIDDVFSNTAKTAAIIVGSGAVLFVIIAIVTVVLLVRARRRRRAAAAAVRVAGWAVPEPGWPPPSVSPSGWGAPPSTTPPPAAPG